jgi:hypothetical protein
VPPNEDPNLERLAVTLACAAPAPPPAVGNRLFLPGPSASAPRLDWSGNPAAASHYHVYRATAKVDLPGTRVAEPTALAWSDGAASEPLVLYQVRAAVDCGDLESGN